MLREPGITAPLYLILVTYFFTVLRSHCSNHLAPKGSSYQHVIIAARAMSICS